MNEIGAGARDSGLATRLLKARQRAEEGDNRDVFTQAAQEYPADPESRIPNPDSIK
jgi:hypothetical protein